MKRNTYVTAGLFVLFGLLTVVYWQMSDREEEAQIPIIGTLSNPISGVATIGEVSESEEVENEDAEAIADAQDAEVEDEEADETVNSDEESEAEDQSSREVISRIDVLRASMEEGRTQQVAALTEIIANAEYDALMKSAAKDTLNEIQTLANSSRMLESVIGHMGFDDVLVDATIESVRVTIQVTSLTDVPSREELAELYVLAGIEFGNHRNGNISIDFQPLN